MASIIPGFTYDIFISYRQKDNKHEGWVTEFVASLKNELDATFKNEVSIYFDIDPHEGLLENHIVQKSLDDKLNAAILIPVISQTYCDPKGYAWQFEFVAFNKMARSQPMGRDIRVSGGNVASRILPVIINTPDDEDKQSLAQELDGPLRGIEFIYAEPGVRRPLRPDDNETRNLNHTLYRNQINKVALAIKDILRGMQQLPQPQVKVAVPVVEPKRKSKLTYIVACIIVLVAIAGLALKYLPGGKDGEPANATANSPKTVAILPFVDLSEAKDQEWFSDGLTEEILNSMAAVDELHVTARTSSFAFKNKNIPIRQIADSLGVAYIVEGSVRKVEDKLRITAQLIRAEDGMHLWSQTYDRSSKDVFSIQGDIAQNITESLNIYIDDKKKEEMFSKGTRNVEAYEAYLKGKSILNAGHNDFSIKMSDAAPFFRKAVQLDKEFAAAYYLDHDIFAHYIIDFARLKVDSLTVEGAYKLMINDLDAAIRYTKNDGHRMAYMIDKTFMSNDWSSLPALIAKLKNDKKIFDNFAFSNDGWILMILMGIDEDALADRLLERSIRENPLEYRFRFHKTTFMIAKGDIDSVRYMFKKAKEQVGMSQQIESSEYFINVFMDAEAQVKEDKMKYLVPAQKGMLYGKLGERKKAEEFLKNRPNEVVSDLAAMFTLHYLGNDPEANKLAHNIDEQLFGPQLMIAKLFTFGGYVPFNLSSTPNLEARFREAGIDIAAYQKKNAPRGSKVPQPK